MSQEGARGARAPGKHSSAALEERVKYLEAQLSDLVGSKRSVPHSSPKTKRRRGEQDDETELARIPHSDVFTNKEINQDYVLKKILQFTVYMFALNHRPANRWVSPQMKSVMNLPMGAYDPYCGMAVALFALPRTKTAKWKAYRQGLGAVWSWMMTHALCGVFYHQAQRYFIASDPADVNCLAGEPPSWLDLGGNGDMRKDLIWLHTQVLYFQTHSKILSQEHELAFERKYLGVASGNTDSELSGYGSTSSRSATIIDSEGGLCALKTVIKRCCREQKRMLNEGRHEVRAQIYEKLGFVLNVIAQKDSPEAARSEGYWLELPDNDAETELRMPYRLTPGSSWDIPDAVTTDDDMGRNRNRENFEKLQRDFPSLHGVLRWPQYVSPPKHSHGKDAREEYDRVWRDCGGRIVHRKTESISFHQLAVTFLIAISRCNEVDQLFRSNKLALKAIHIFALGLRGVCQRVLWGTTTEAESAASNNVTAYKLEDPEVTDVVTLLLGGCAAEQQMNDGSALNAAALNESGKKKRNQIDRQRFEISWADYCAARNASVAISATSAGAAPEGAGDRGRGANNEETQETEPNAQVNVRGRRRLANDPAMLAVITGK